MSPAYLAVYCYYYYIVNCSGGLERKLHKTKADDCSCNIYYIIQICYKLILLLCQY